MPVYQALVLAVIQSLTEFLPISSTAHLALVPWLLGWRDPGLDFDVALHLGTLAGLVGYFWRDWLTILSAAFRGPRPQEGSGTHQPRLLWLLVLATAPAVAAGLAFDRYAETTWRHPYMMGSLLILVAGVMYWADRRAACRREVAQVTLAEAMWIGCAQAIALMPGVSRSGITISVALLLGLTRPAAARFSFLLATPALAGAALKTAWDLYQAQGLAPAMQGAFGVGVLASAVASWLVVAFFLRFLRSHTLRFFVYYRVVFGIIVIARAVYLRHWAA